MLMEYAVGATTGAIAVGLVYGLKKFFNLLEYKRDGHSWKESFSVIIEKWYDWVSVIIAILLILMIIFGIAAGVILG